MADSNYATPLHSAFPPAPALGAPTLRTEPSEPHVPNYPSYADPFAASELPALTNYSNLHRPQLPDPYSGFPAPYTQNRQRQPHVQGGPRAAGYLPSTVPIPTMPMFHQGPNAATSAQTPAPPNFGAFSLGPHFHNCPEPRTLPFMDLSNQNGTPNFNASLPSWPSPPIPEFHRLPNVFTQNSPPSPVRLRGDGLRAVGEGRNPMAARRAEAGTADAPRHMTSPGRRASYDRQFQHTQASGGSERRSLSSLIGSPTRRTDRSVSPRTSNRRSFDRYATDLTQPGSNLDSNDATQAQMHRARRARVSFPSSLRARMYGSGTYSDPNVPRPAQMQNLKDKLRHLLPSELPEDASTMCDICQKDYSTEHVEPSEEAEVAIMLPCKHIFGEHCINTWFETCKAHKNKITCPMCRKLLIEPMRSGLEALQNLPAAERRLVERMMQGDGRQFFDMGRELQGDFTHP